MRTPSFTRQFERDLRRMRKRGKDIDKLKSVMATLIEEQLLAERHRDHALIGNWRGRRECHVEPDWLLIYKLQADETDAFSRWRRYYRWRSGERKRIKRGYNRRVRRQV